MRLALLFALCLAIVNGQEESCRSADEDPYLLFGTKTAYTFANKGIPVNRAHDVPGCQPLAIWMVNRHGSHNPEADEFPGLQKLVVLKNNIIINYRNGNFRNTNLRMCMSDVNLLERWEWNPRLNISFAGDLTSDGYIASQQLAQAWKQRFPGLLTDNVHDYLFKYVNDQRSSTTFRAFTEGLFRAQADNIDISKESDEKLLRPYKFCPSWSADVEENADTLSQLHIFESKQEYKEMINNVSRRLGFNYDIERDVLHSLYDMCRYDKAWAVTQISPWCAAFTKDDLKRLEYSEDLLTYYKYGYGSPKNQEIGCTGVKDMMDFFRTHVDKETPQQPRAVIHFTEAQMLLLTLQALGARRDLAPLTGDNYHTAVAQSRKWSSSAMTPFNANLAAVLYKCTPNSNFQVNDPYQVLFLENERPLYLEECRVGLCSWSFVKNRFGLIADNCNLNFCNGAGQIKISFFGLALALLLKMLY
ncbi:multiple inositol polyphosphate phosphatase 1-like [Maniola hyperantus]|uniref:multiple inositol polyphosphate phosphatase 1-like n=1 Tax=Aphantopus hyperantus TaxID=2795564 RepID=UPI001569C24F|nr:multiple inositol polyphosphate phosphatase 1-like [Maniola hyperantus]XP_034830732.1 multiple inositol polyphosphate phosphatase 1-like [Maniola hyperantus]